MDSKLPLPPSQQDVELRFRDTLVRHGEIKTLAAWLDADYDYFLKQVNPNSPEKSDFYRAARLLWALRMVDEEKAWKAVDLLVEIVFSDEGKLQLVNRIQSDLARLKQELTGNVERIDRAAS